MYAKFRTALAKLADRKDEIVNLRLVLCVLNNIVKYFIKEVAQTNDNFNAAKQALLVSSDSFTRLRVQASEVFYIL
jgi:hypothetical protein